MVQAGGAKKAVTAVLAKFGEQVTRDDARELLSALNDAREASIARRSKASRTATTGRNINSDIQALQRAQDALATTTLDTDKRLEQRLRIAAAELDMALRNIAENSTRDGWADAVGVLQGITPVVDVHQRKLGTKALS